MTDGTTLKKVAEMSFSPVARNTKQQDSLLQTGVYAVRNSVHGLWCEQPRDPGGFPAAAWVNAGQRGRTKGPLLGEEMTWARLFSIQHPHATISTGTLPGEQRALGGSQPPQEQGKVWSPTD